MNKIIFLGQYSLFTIITASLFSACTTTKLWKSADVLIDPTDKETAQFSRMVEKKDIELFDAYILVNGSSAEKLKSKLKPLESDSTIEKRYCGMLFDVQPTLFDGAIRNVYLSDRRIQALENVQIYFEKNGGQCFLVKGTAVELKAKND